MNDVPYMTISNDDSERMIYFWGKTFDYRVVLPAHAFIQIPIQPVMLQPVILDKAYE